MQIAYAEFTLDEILKLYAKGLQVKDGDKISKVEHFVDVAQGKVLYRVFVQQAGEDQPAPLIVLPD